MKEARIHQTRHPNTVHDTPRRSILELNKKVGAWIIKFYQYSLKKQTNKNITQKSLLFSVFCYSREDAPQKETKFYIDKCFGAC